MGRRFCLLSEYTSAEPGQVALLSLGPSEGSPHATSACCFHTEKHRAMCVYFLSDAW